MSPDTIFFAFVAASALMVTLGAAGGKMYFEFMKMRERERDQALRDAELKAEIRLLHARQQALEDRERRLEHQERMAEHYSTPSLESRPWADSKAVTPEDWIAEAKRRDKPQLWEIKRDQMQQEIRDMKTSQMTPPEPPTEELEKVEELDRIPVPRSSLAFSTPVAVTALLKED